MATDTTLLADRDRMEKHLSQNAGRQTFFVSISQSPWTANHSFILSQWSTKTTGVTFKFELQLDDR